MIGSQQSMAIVIDDIVATTCDGVCVIVHDTGRPAWLPRAHTSFYPHLAVVPRWLADRIGKRRGDAA